jgi:hypothetical protein
MQRLYQVVDPDKPEEVATLRVSKRDGDAALRQMRKLDTAVPFEWQFEDVTEVVFRRPLPPWPR